MHGAEEHVNHPDSIAWKSMCATDEGKQKGEKWCKRAIWGNTLPEIKHVWKSVDNLTSGAFVKMWQQQVDRYYARLFRSDDEIRLSDEPVLNSSSAVGHDKAGFLLFDRPRRREAAGRHLRRSHRAQIKTTSTISRATICGA